MMNEWFEAEQHAEQAHQYYEAGQWEKALDELQRALSCNPEQGEWHFGAGLVLEELRRYEDAVTSFREAMERQPDEPDVMLHLGRCLLQLHQPAEALEILERVNELDPDCEPGYCQRILAYTLLGDHDQAQQMFYLARQVIDECPHCYHHIAQSLVQTDEPNKAIWCWEQALKLEPHYPDAYANLAKVHWRQGEHARARSFFLRQIRATPGAPAHVQSLMDLGVLLSEMGRYGEAREKLKQALEMNPSLAKARLHLGELALRHGHLDAAEAELQVAQRLDSTLAGVRMAIARVEQQRGHLGHARVLMKEERLLHPHTAAQRVEMARLMVELRMADAAVEILQPVFKIVTPQPPTDLLSNAYLSRGVAMLLLNQRDRGIIDLKLALTFDNQNTLAMHNLTLAYLEIGEVRRARFWLLGAMKLRPADPVLRQLRLRLITTTLTCHLRNFWHRLTRRSRKI